MFCETVSRAKGMRLKSQMKTRWLKKPYEVLKKVFGEWMQGTFWGLFCLYLFRFRNGKKRLMRSFLILFHSHPELNSSQEMWLWTQRIANVSSKVKRCMFCSMLCCWWCLIFLVLLHELFGGPEKTTTTNIVCTKKEPNYEEPMTLLARFVDQFTGIAEVMSSSDFF